MNKKEAHELAVTRRMLDVLNIPYSHIRAGNPDIKEPDCVITTQTGILGVEVTTAYYSIDAAKADWQPNKFMDKHAELGLYFPRSGIDEPDAKMAEEIPKRIDSKVGNQYFGADRLMLLVHLEACMTSDEDINRFIESGRITVSGGGPFSAIYLGTAREEGIYKVWPVFSEPTKA